MVFVNAQHIKVIEKFEQGEPDNVVVFLDIHLPGEATPLGFAFQTPQGTGQTVASQLFSGVPQEHIELKCPTCNRPKTLKFITSNCEGEPTGERTRETIYPFK
jgi:phage FluMu protein Com